MSLFDDLLTKVQSPSSSSGSTGSSGSSSWTGWSGQQDPLVNTESIIISAPTPIETSRDIIEPPPPPPPPVQSPMSVPVVEVTDSSLILSSVWSEEVTLNKKNDLLFAEETFKQNESLNINPEINTTWLFFDKINDSTDIEVPTVTESVFNTEVPTVTESVSPEKENNKIELQVEFRDTAEYISHAILEVSKLISTLDLTNDAKLAEKDQYKEQKKHFAELEKEAEAEHKKMVEERKHAENMKTYLENELIKTKTPANDETFAIAV